MRRAIAQANPFIQVPRFALAYEVLPEKARVLDFGCHDGQFGSLLKQYRNIDYVGIDKNHDAIKNAAADIEVRELAFPLPFVDQEFDAVMMLEVLEHIADQNRVLSQVFRVLKPGGLLLVSAPRRHIFSFLDLANFKFVFPKLHQWYYSRSRSADAYRRRYANNSDHLIGDIEREKSWHQHFTDNDMRQLLQCNGFCVEDIDGFGFFNVLFTFLATVVRLGFCFPQSVRDWDSRTFHSSSLLCVARRPAREQSVVSGINAECSRRNRRWAVRSRSERHFR
jgi:SAM-dependent methyltransferase